MVKYVLNLKERNVLKILIIFCSRKAFKFYKNLLKRNFLTNINSMKKNIIYSRSKICSPQKQVQAQD